MIGTPFISEDGVTQRKVDKVNKKPWEQEVRDEKGRKRLHGAFTGGFSAGYFNTVGTKEGWTTAQFRSSRGDKISSASIQPIKKKQDVMDFMDEEDIKDQIGEAAITSKAVHKDYLSSLQLRKEDEETLKEEVFKNEFSSAASVVTIKEFAPQFNNLIGSMLMRAAGFSESEFELIAGNTQVNNVNKDYNKGFFTNDLIKGTLKNTEYVNNAFTSEIKNKYYNGKLEFKDDYYGAGYFSLISDDIFGTRKAQENIISNGNTANVNKNIIRMDKFEDDEEFGFYTSSGANDKQKYNFEILDENYLNDNEKELKRKRLRENMDTDLELSAQKFIKAENILHSVDILEFKMPVLPKDYDPFTVDYIKNENIEAKNYYNIEAEINKLKPATAMNTSSYSTNFNNIDKTLICNVSSNEDKDKFKIHQKIDANKRSEILDLELEMNEIKQPNIFPESYNPYLQSKFTKAEVCDFKSLNENKLIYNPNENQNLNKINTKATNDNIQKAIKSAPSTLEQFNNYFHLKVNVPFKDDVSKIARFEKKVFGDLKRRCAKGLESKILLRTRSILLWGLNVMIKILIGICAMLHLRKEKLSIR